MGIEITFCESINLQNLKIEAKSHSIMLSQNTYIRIEGVHCISAEGSSLFSANVQSNYCLITNSIFKGNANNVFYLRRFQHSQISNCIIESTGGVTLGTMQYCGYCIVSNNTLKSEGGKFIINSGNYNLCCSNISTGSISSNENATEIINNIIIEL